MGYSFKDYNSKTMARALGNDLPISLKQSIEICNFIRKRSVAQSKSLLAETISQKRAIPYKRFTGGAGHKRGMASGKYPLKASKEFIKLLSAVEANAVFKGQNSANLYILHISAHTASNPMHYGRHRGRQMKRANIEVVVEERATESKQTEKQQKKAEKQQKQGDKQVEQKQQKERPVEKMAEKQQIGMKKDSKKYAEKQTQKQPEKQEKAPVKKKPVNKNKPNEAEKVVE